jgi:hypothetical protein
MVVSFKERLLFCLIRVDNQYKYLMIKIHCFNEVANNC